MNWFRSGFAALCFLVLMCNIGGIVYNAARGDLFGMLSSASSSFSLVCLWYVGDWFFFRRNHDGR